MNQESGRSLIEVIGVLAIGAVLAAGALATYNTVRARMTRTIAAQQLADIAKNTKLLFGPIGDYAGVSVDYLIRAGALASDRAPIGGADWSVDGGADGSYFTINLTGLSSGECDWIATVPLDWAQSVRVNDTEVCMNGGDNKVSITVE